MINRLVLAVSAVILLVGASPALSSAQTSVATILGRPATPDGQPKTYLEELQIYSFIDNSFVGNLRGAGRGNVNELRLYDHDAGYTFNSAELSVKKDPSERYRLGYGLVVTAGVDSQKTHSLGMFRGMDDQFPYRNTPPLDVPEAYAAYLVPLGKGLTVKAGKWATPIGYEGYETPKNLNFSRSFLFSLGEPTTHTGVLLTYPVTGWLAVSAGFSNGWDNSDNNNGYLRPMVILDFTPTDKLEIATHAMWGPEQNRDQMRGDHVNTQWIVDTTVSYTGIDKLTLGLNVDFAGEENDPALVALGTRKNNDSRWSGVAGYAAYDWTKSLRTALRAEYFSDPQGVRSSETSTPGHDVELWETTATVQYNVWKGLFTRVEYRHDEANRKAFDVRNPGPAPTSHAQDTIMLELYYVFF